MTRKSTIVSIPIKPHTDTKIIRLGSAKTPDQSATTARSFTSPAPI